MAIDSLIRYANKQRYLKYIRSKKNRYENRREKQIRCYSEKQKLLNERQKYLKEHATKSELIFMKRLKDAKIKFMFQKGFISGDDFCIVDFYIPKHRICVEIDGGYHNTDKQRARDYYRTKYLEEVRNTTVIRVKNEDVYTFDINFLK